VNRFFATFCKMPATQGGSVELNEEDRKKLVKDALFHVITQEAKRPVIKRPDVFKAIGLTGRTKELQDSIWNRTIKDLKDVFGYQMKELDDKKGFILVNLFEDSCHQEMRHIIYDDKDKTHIGLLIVVLSVIYMNNGVVKEETLFGFLKKLNLFDDNDPKKEFEPFGNVKNLIDKEWCNKQHYIQLEKDELAASSSGDPDQNQYKYRWGERAFAEVKKSDVLKFVASVYEKKPNEFTEEYENIINEEGEGIFEEDK